MTTNQELTIEQLLQFLANATKTHYNCGGHTKAEMNLMKAEEWKIYLQERHINIPPDEELLKVGIFNGEGSA